MNYYLKNEYLDVVVKSMGAELTSIKTSEDEFEYLWQADERYWIRQSPVLFPIVGKVENNKYLVGGDEFEIQPHGFAKESEFLMLEKSDSQISFTLTSNKDTLKKYPFKFELSITYRLVENEVRTRYLVTNTDEKTMWFSIGAHPGFKCPMAENEVMNDYYLEFEKKEHICRAFLEDGGLLNGKERLFLDGENILRLSHELFSERAIILKGLKSRKVTLKSDKHRRYVTVKYDGFPYVGIWSPKNNAPFVCIEPWYGVASTKGTSPKLKEKAGILSLQPGETFTCEYGIEIG